MTPVPTHGFPVGMPGYEALGLLGQGASGQVFKARQHSTGQLVAIKVPGALATHDPATRRRVHQRLHQETRVLALLHHSHVVRLLDKGMAHGGFPYAVLEYVPGETLREFLQRRGRLSLVDTAELMAQLLDALSFLHAHHVVHRDLKPENVMVVPTGVTLHAKVLDFGLASHQGAPRFTTGAEGTPAYCAPEQLRGDACVPATDIYAWALMFVECLCARPCVQGASISEVLRRQLSPVPIALPDEVQRSPVAALLLRALHKTVHQRTADATRLHRELADCLAQLRAAPYVPPALVPALLAGTPVKPGMPGIPGTSEKSWVAGMPGAARMAGTMDRGVPKNPTMDPSLAAQAQARATPSRAILSLTLRLYPARDASLGFSDLQEIREQQLRWCSSAVQSGQGHDAGTLGDCMLFHFDQLPSSAENLQQAAALAQDLCLRVQRRSRMLEVQHGVRLEISGGMHTAAPKPSGASPDSRHAANVTLYLNSLAGPGTVVLSHSAHSELAGSVHSEAYSGADPVRLPEPEPVYRLTPAMRP